MNARILLIEDDASAGAALQKVLRAEHYHVDHVRRGDEGLVRARAGHYDLVLTDFRMPGLSGLELIAQLHASNPKLPIIMMTAHGTTKTAIEATKLGACEYLTKPFEADELLDRAAAAVRSARLMSEPVELAGEKEQGQAIIGNSRAMQAVYKEIGRVAATPVAVLIRGATGTGKELIARALYQHSDRAGKPFIAVNCAAIPQGLIESELFGHERGAFTGAHSRRIGRFEQAHDGTLFLDEVGDLPIDTQAKLLRVLQERQFQRVGGDELIRADVRVIAATHRDLESAIRENEFREDLFFRLSVVTVRVPPLHERAEDIPELVRYFIRRYAGELGVENPSIQSEAVALLQKQPWPGNVRELENVVRRALLLARPFGVSAEHVQRILVSSAPRPPLSQQTHAAYITELLDRAERGEVEGAYWQMIAELEPELFRQVMDRAGGNQARAARWLGITRLKLRERFRELGKASDRETNLEPGIDGT
jgi:nitrogen regulation protein NR(I)